MSGPEASEPAGSAARWEEIRVALSSGAVEERWSAVSRIRKEIPSGFRPAVEWLASRCLEAGQADGSREHAADEAAFASALAQVASTGDAATIDALASLVLAATDPNTAEAALEALTRVTKGGIAPKGGCSDAATRHLLLAAFPPPRSDPSSSSSSSSLSIQVARGVGRLSVRQRATALALALCLGGQDALQRAGQAGGAWRFAGFTQGIDPAAGKRVETAALSACNQMVAAQGTRVGERAVVQLIARLYSSIIPGEEKEEGEMLAGSESGCGGGVGDDVEREGASGVEREDASQDVDATREECAPDVTREAEEVKREEGAPDEGDVRVLWHWVPETAARSRAKLRSVWGDEHGESTAPSLEAATREALVRAEFRPADLKVFPRATDPTLPIFSETDWGAKFLDVASNREMDSSLLAATHRRTVPESDAREALRGQDTLIAAQLIPQGSVFPVNCPVAYEDEYYARLPTEADVEESDRYAYEFIGGQADTERGLPWIADLYRGGEARLLNDAKGSTSRANLEFVELVWKGFPALIVVALLDILPGSEMLIEYGDEYWDAQEAPVLRSEVVRDVLLQEIPR